MGEMIAVLDQTVEKLQHENTLLMRRLVSAENAEIIWRLQETLDESCNGGFNDLEVFGWEITDVLKTMEKLLAGKDAEKIKLSCLDKKYWDKNKEESKQLMEELKDQNYVSYWDK